MKFFVCIVIGVLVGLMLAVVYFSFRINESEKTNYALQHVHTANNYMILLNSQKNVRPDLSLEDFALCALYDQRKKIEKQVALMEEKPNWKMLLSGSSPTVEKLKNSKKQIDNFFDQNNWYCNLEQWHKDQSIGENGALRQ